MRKYSPREVLETLYSDGWYVVKITRDHCCLKHPIKPYKIVVAQAKKNIPTETIRIIAIQAKIPFDQ